MIASHDKRLREQREEVVRRHVAAENTGDLDGMIASFHRPRYQVIPMGAVWSTYWFARATRDQIVCSAACN